MKRSDRLGMILGAGNVGLGLVMLLGHPSRTSGASFTYLRQLADVRLWGVAFLVAGLLALGSSWLRARRLELLGHFLAGFLCAFLVACFWAARSLPNVSLTGVVAYGTLAAGHLDTAARALPRRPRLPRV